MKISMQAIDLRWRNCRRFILSVPGERARSGSGQGHRGIPNIGNCPSHARASNRLRAGPSAIRLERRPVGVESGNRGRILLLGPAAVADGPAEPGVGVALVPKGRQRARGPIRFSWRSSRRGIRSGAVCWITGRTFRAGQSTDLAMPGADRLGWAIGGVSTAARTAGSRTPGLVAGRAGPSVWMRLPRGCGQWRTTGSRFSGGSPSVWMRLPRGCGWRCEASRRSWNRRPGTPASHATDGLAGRRPALRSGRPDARRLDDPVGGPASECAFARRHCPRPALSSRRADPAQWTPRY